jgi:hypothetical protein
VQKVGLFQELEKFQAIFLIELPENYRHLGRFVNDKLISIPNALDTSPDSCGLPQRN